MVLHPANHVERRGVDALHHRRQHVTRRFVVLVGIDADRELVGRARRLEYALTCRASGVENHVDALVVLTERQLLALARILECVGRDAGVLRDHLTIGTDFLDAGSITRLELVNERDVHPAHESDFSGVTHQRRQRAHQIRSLFFSEFQRGDIRRRRNHVSFRISGQGVVDSGERGIGIFLRQVGQIVREDEADTDDEIHSLSRQQSQACFAISSLTRLDESDVGAEHFRRAVGSGVSAIVERFVTSATDIQHDSNANRGRLFSLGDGAPTGEKERNMYSEEQGGDDDQFSHLNRRIAQNTRGCKTIIPLSNASYRALISAHGRADKNALSRSGKRSCWSSHCVARLG